MNDVLIEGGRVLDPVTGEYSENTDLRIEAGVVVDRGGSLSAPSNVRRVDARGLTVLPGLIDAHVHVVAATADLTALTSWSPSYTTAHAARLMAAMLRRGFTSVRDVGGADYGLAAAQAEGLLPGPRIFFGGRALSQTGGHGDPRGAGVEAHPCGPNTSRVVDGVTEARRAARDELRKGAYHLKVMASGGVASPTDRVDSTQFSQDELRAIVEEATAANRYVTAHAYTARAIEHALRAGIRCIEHGNLIDPETITFLVRQKAWLVPTLVTYRALKQEGADYGLPPASIAKVDDVLHAGLAALESAHRMGAQIAFGTDLLGGMQRRQCEEFRIRAEVIDPIDVIRQATVNAAELLGQSGHFGDLRVGAHGDAIVVLAEPEHHLRHVIQAGAVV